MEKLQMSWIRLQVSTNVVLDSELDKLNNNKKLAGVKQVSSMCH